MTRGKISALLVTFGGLLFLPARGRPVYAQPLLDQQNASVEAEGTRFDPLKYVTSDFPGSVTLKGKGHLLEFCPDNTCDGFVSSAIVPETELKDFAYLYIYFFSEYIYLPDWRGHAEVKNAAKRVLARPEYSKCKSQRDVETARCVLLDLSRNGRIKLIFVRYDENRRNVVPEDITKELSRRTTSER